MRFSQLVLIAFVAALARCSPSGGQEKGHGPGGGMPPPEVNVVTVAPQSLPAAFEYVGQTAGSREVEARAELPNAEGALSPGQFVRVILHGAVRPNALLVPQRAAVADLFRALGG